MRKIIIFALNFCCVLSICVLIAGESVHPKLSCTSKNSITSNAEELNTNFWYEKAQSILAEKLKKHANNKPTNMKRRAKNIILFLGDGMSVHTITATRSFMGGDIAQQVSFDQFPYVGLSKTYAVDKRVPDSASTATAYLSGVKANYGTIGVTAEVKRYNCNKANDTNTHTASLAKWAQDAGMWSGLVTTARVTHASPAGVYAHTANRDWENDAAIEANHCSAHTNTDIARQLIEWPVGSNLRVILGGGRRNFRDKHQLDEEGQHGYRTDGRDLIKTWLNDKNANNFDASYVWSKQTLNAIDIDKKDYLLGLFSASHCPYNNDIQRDGLEEQIPTLTEMTEAAIRLLSKSEQGYFLFVEGAKIDMAHHSNKARKSLEETAEFSRAIDLARSMTNEDDTLIVVTSDHSHTMTISGYPQRGQDILGLAPTNADDDLPYTILSYANGPGFSKTYSSNTGRRDLSKVDLTDPEYKYMATVPLDSETHGGDDVAVFASGPYENYFTGNFEQNIIPALMAHAANIGPFKEQN